MKYLSDAIHSLANYDLYYDAKNDYALDSRHDFSVLKDRFSYIEDILVKANGEKFVWKDEHDVLVGVGMYSEIKDIFEKSLSYYDKNITLYDFLSQECKDKSEIINFVNVFIKDANFSLSQEDFLKTYKVFHVNEEASSREDKFLKQVYSLLGQELETLTPDKIIDLTAELVKEVKDYKNLFCSRDFQKALVDEFKDRVEENKNYFEFINKNYEGEPSFKNEIISKIAKSKTNVKPYSSTLEEIRDKFYDIHDEEEENYMNVGGIFLDLGKVAIGAGGALGAAFGYINPVLGFINGAFAARTFINGLVIRDDQGDLDRFMTLSTNIKEYFCGDRNLKILKEMRKIEGKNKKIRDVLDSNDVDLQLIKTSLNDSRYSTNIVTKLVGYEEENNKNAKLFANKPSELVNDVIYGRDAEISRG